MSGVFLFGSKQEESDGITVIAGWLVGVFRKERARRIFALSAKSVALLHAIDSSLGFTQTPLNQTK